ncbi:HesA/MoeB/ThiF family protein [Xylophilus ampelinus]|nr:ThiF family adenylyltransferase [Xylophilus ampelinus]MCS4509936.1 ThiF family adenylyltransferase [Xylophilus ampelinus]
MINQFMDDRNHVRDGIVSVGGNIVGLCIPSTVIGNDGEKIYINSRDGIASFKPDGAESFWEALIKSGSILFGSAEEVAQSAAYLKNPRLSRTTSYLCTESSNCADLIKKVCNIASANVVIIGCGGIGSLAAMNLAGAGVAKLTLIDHDTIEESNLNRQFFWTKQHIGLPKVNVLRSEIFARYSDIDVSTESSLLDINSIVSLADAHDACIVIADEPLGISANIAALSRAFVVSDAYFHRYSCYFARFSSCEIGTSSINWSRGPNIIAPSFGPANTEIAGAISSLCLNYLSDRHSLDSVNVNYAWRSNRLANQQ